ncbi:hypothetical protein MRX96_047935 [Rhipicephalus microplus]
MADAFSDTLAMSLVAVGLILIGLLIWVLMRLYNREYRREAAPSRIATPGTGSPADTTATIVGPFRTSGKNLPTHGMDSGRPSAEVSEKPKDHTAQQPSQAQVEGAAPKSPTAAIVEPGPPSASHDLDDPTLQKLRKEVILRRASHTSTRSIRPRPAVKDKIEANLDIFSEKHSSASIAEAMAAQEKKTTHEHKHEHEQESKHESRHDSKHDSKHEHKCETPVSGRVSTAGAGGVQASSGALSHSTSPAKSPESPGKSGASESGGVDASTIEKLRRDIMMRRASYVSQHSLRPPRRAFNVPSDLDIFSSEHSSESNVLAGSTSRADTKHKSNGPEVKLAAPSTGATPGTGDLDEHTVRQLQQDVMKRRASHVSVPSLRQSNMQRNQLPADLDIFSDQHASFMEDPSPLLKKKKHSKPNILSEPSSLE